MSLRPTNRGLHSISAEIDPEVSNSSTAVKLALGCSTSHCAGMVLTWLVFLVICQGKSNGSLRGNLQGAPKVGFNAASGSCTGFAFGRSFHGPNDEVVVATENSEVGGTAMPNRALNSYS